MTDADRENLDLERRMAAALDGELAPDQRADLDRELMRNPEARQWMEQTRELDQRVADALSAALTPLRDQGQAAPGRLARPQRRQVRWRAVAAAAAVLLAVGAGLWMGVGQFGTGAPVAQTPTPSIAPVMAATRGPGAGENGRHLLLDVADISPLQDTPRRGDRFIDRQYFGVFDEETRELHLIEVDRVRTREDTEYLDW